MDPCAAGTAGSGAAGSGAAGASDAAGSAGSVAAGADATAFPNLTSGAKSSLQSLPVALSIFLLIISSSLSLSLPPSLIF